MFFSVLFHGFIMIKLNFYFEFKGDMNSHISEVVTDQER